MSLTAMQMAICQKRPSFKIFIFAPPNGALGACPLPAATGRHRLQTPLIWRRCHLESFCIPCMSRGL